MKHFIPKLQHRDFFLLSLLVLATSFLLPSISPNFPFLLMKLSISDGPKLLGTMLLGALSLLPTANNLFTSGLSFLS